MIVLHVFKQHTDTLTNVPAVYSLIAIMEPTILFLTSSDVYQAYVDLIQDGLQRRGFHPRVARPQEQHDPASIDYIVYAPTSSSFADNDLSRYTNVKLVQSLWAGVDSIIGNKTLTQPLARMVERGMTEGMVQYVMCHLYRHLLRNYEFESATRRGTWVDSAAPPLAPQFRVAILGLGELGAACAEKAYQNGFVVCGWSGSTKRDMDFPCFCGIDALERDVLPNCDVVVTLLPLTRDTKHLLNEQRLRMMKHGASIINPGRGKLVDEGALLRCLDEHHLSFATLDVFATEPLPSDHCFWRHERVLVTPHVASHTRPSTASETVVDNIARSCEGKEVLHVVDRDREY